MTLVACTGIATLDLVLAVDELPSGDGKYLAHARDESGGGVAANAAVTVARLGDRATLASAVGDDDIGERIVADLARYGVDTRRAARIAGVPSPLSVVLVDRTGARLVVNHTDPRLFDRVDPEQAASTDGADAVRFATAAAAAKCLASGGRAAIPDRLTVEALDLPRP